jgi:hypothetical protein
VKHLAHWCVLEWHLFFYPAQSPPHQASSGQPVESLHQFDNKKKRVLTMANFLQAIMALKNGINAPDAFSGQLRNKQNVGLDNDGYKALWDAEHPGDPLEI